MGDVAVDGKRQLPGTVRPGVLQYGFQRLDPRRQGAVGDVEAVLAAALVPEGAGAVQKGREGPEYAAVQRGLEGVSRGAAFIMDGAAALMEHRRELPSGTQDPGSFGHGADARVFHAELG